MEMEMDGNSDGDGDGGGVGGDGDGDGGGDGDSGDGDGDGGDSGDRIVVNGPRGQLRIDPRTFVTFRVRKYFPRHGFFNGTVTKYKGGDVFRVTYTDGDSEDMGFDELRRVSADARRATTVQ